MNIRLEQAQAIVAGVLEYAASMRMKPICAIVLDARGELKAAATMDEASLKRSSIARGKADGALAMGMGSRSLFKRAKEQPFFISAATHAVGGSLVPVPGGSVNQGRRRQGPGFDAHESACQLFQMDGCEIHRILVVSDYCGPITKPRPNSRLME